MSYHSHPTCCKSKDALTQESRCLNVDKFGAIASFLCAIHCFLTSVAMSALSVMGLGFLGSETTDIIFVCFAITFGLMAVRHGYKHHRSYLPAILFVSGLCMVFVSHFYLGHSCDVESHCHHDVHIVPHWVSDTLAVLGGVTLMSFHIVNAALQRKAKKLSCCS